MNLFERRDVTAATLNRFAAKPFSWSGAATCVHLVRWHIRAMGKPAPTMPRFRSPLTARAALKERGWATLADMMDAVLPRILPAEVIVGDVVEMPGDSEAFGALCIAVGNGRVMGYAEGHDRLTVSQPHGVPVAAWRA
ncbi:DUF6950 family protein [Sphingomonas hankookensis]|uniref:DUF6950 family protein n=1 Tax=Sphingomonas hankookensis TaxID=563996 RepID=UPI003D3032E3